MDSHELPKIMAPAPSLSLTSVFTWVEMSTAVLVYLTIVLILFNRQFKTRIVLWKILNILFDIKYELGLYADSILPQTEYSDNKQRAQSVLSQISALEKEEKVVAKRVFRPVVMVEFVKGEKVETMALLDSSSRYSYISGKLVRNLRMRTSVPKNIVLDTGLQEPNDVCYKSVDVALRGLVPKVNLLVDESNSLTNVDYEPWSEKFAFKIFTQFGIHLTQNFSTLEAKHPKIDLIFGQDLLNQIMLRGAENRIRVHSKLVLLNTVFGWTAMGKLSSDPKKVQPKIEAQKMEEKEEEVKEEGDWELVSMPEKRAVEKVVEMKPKLARNIWDNADGTEFVTDVYWMWYLIKMTLKHAFITMIFNLCALFMVLEALEYAPHLADASKMKSKLRILYPQICNTFWFKFEAVFFTLMVSVCYYWLKETFESPKVLPLVKQDYRPCVRAVALNDRKRRNVRILFASGAQNSWISQSLVQKLGLDSNGKEDGFYSVKLQSLIENPGSKEQEAIEIQLKSCKKIKKNFGSPAGPPKEALKAIEQNYGIKLTDNHWGQNVEIIIGADSIAQFLSFGADLNDSANIKLDDNLMLMKTKLGHVLQGNSRLATMVDHSFD